MVDLASQGIARLEEENKFLREQLARYQDLFKRAPVPYFYVECETGVIVECNMTACRQFDYEEGFLKGTSIMDLYADSDDGRVKAQLVWDSFVAGKPLKHMELKYRCRDGSSFWGVLVIDSVLDEEGRITHGRFTIFDITERRLSELQAREDNKKLKETVEELQRSRAKEKLFTATLSHDIRNPLTTILGMIEVMHDSNLTRNQKNFLKLMREAGQYLHALVNDILDYSKIESGEFHLESKSFNLHRLVMNTVGRTSYYF
ncbi:PAS domain S-box protein [Patescibacteria group bacterium]|nr:PAS domain S-box protein [Patescibacteria group bacterium]